MRLINFPEWMGVLTGPLGFVCGAVLMKFPEWLGGAVTSACAIAFPKNTDSSVVDAAEPNDEDPPEKKSAWATDPGSIQSLVDEMLEQSRYALLLRPQLVENLTVDQLIRTRAALSEGMCLVPEGQVVLHRGAGICDHDAGPPAAASVPVFVSAYYFDRFPVTNAQFHDFRGQRRLRADGDLGSGDLAGGARFRRPDGPARAALLAQRPLSARRGSIIRWWASAGTKRRPTARWAGKRLPTDAEWVKAGSWPVALAGHRYCSGAIPGARRWTAPGPTCGARDRGAP